jgi:thymidylate kinase
VTQAVERQKAAGKERDRIESEGEGFLERVREAYRTLVREEAGRVLLDGAPPPAEVHGSVRDLLGARFPEHFPPPRG